MVRKILISQPRPSSEKSPYFDMEKEYGVELVFRPFIKVEGLSQHAENQIAQHFPVFLEKFYHKK